MPGVYGIPDSQGREQGSRPKGTDCQERKNPRKEAGSKCDSWCPGQRGCSGNRDKLNSQGLGIWEQNLSVAKMEWFEEQLNFTSKSNIFSTGCLNTKIPPLTEGAVCVCACVCMRLATWSCLTLQLHGARQAPLSMGFSRQKYWSGLPCPPPGGLPGNASAAWEGGKAQ